MAEGFDENAPNNPDQVHGSKLQLQSGGVGDDKQNKNISTSRFSSGCTLEDRYEKLNIFKNPVCLIYTDEQGKLAVNEGVLSEIRQIDVPLNVVSVCGIYRTGKSYLLNRLAGTTSGFSLGMTIKSHTKGIWAWCKMHPKQTGQILLLLDTEGLGDIEKGDSNHDNHLFSLALLLSSTMIYNIKGVFNKEALEKLTFIAQLSEEVHVIGNDDSNRTNHNLIRAISPFFILCLRDFFLDMDDQDESVGPDEYLEKCLKQKSKPGHDSYNQTKECIKNFFPNRKCFTLAQPAMGTTLKYIEGREDEKLDPDFIRDVNKMRDFVYEQKHKKLDAVTNVSVDGFVFAEITSTYVQTLRNGLRLTYQDAFEQVAQYHNNNLLEQLLQDFNREMDELKLPFAQKTQLLKLFSNKQDKLLSKFREDAYPFRKGDFEEQAMEKMQNKSDEIRMINRMEVQQICKVVLETYYGDLIEKDRKLYSSKDGFEKYTAHMGELENEYHENMKDYDDDERMMAWEEFKSSKDDEKMRIYREATKELDQARYDQLKKDMEKKIKDELQRQVNEMMHQREVDFQIQISKLEETLSSIIEADSKRERTYESERVKLDRLMTSQRAMEIVKIDEKCLVM